MPSPSSRTFGRPPYRDASEEHEELQDEHTSIQSDTDALEVVTDEILAEVVEIEKHLHNHETWFGISGDQSGNDWAADTLAPFTAISGNGDYGSDPDDEAKVFGTADTPHRAGMTFFDMHRLLIVDASSTSQYKLRIVYGTGTMADAITANQFTTVMVKVDAAVQGSPALPVDIMMPRLAAGTKVWVQCRNDDDEDIDFFAGIHEYAE